MDNFTDQSLQNLAQDSSGRKRRRKYLTVATWALLGAAILGTFGFILHIDEGIGFPTLLAPMSIGGGAGLILSLLYFKLTAERSRRLFLEQERAENLQRAYAEVEGRFRDFIAAAADRFWETDRNHAYCYMSPPVGSMSRAPDEVIGITPWDMKSRQRNPEQNRVLREAFQRQEAFRNIEQQGITPEGKLVHLLHSGLPRYDEDGKFAGFRGTITDATEEYDARAELDQARTEFQEAMEELDAGFVLWDKDDRLVYCNSYFKEIHGDAGDLLLPGVDFEAFVRKCGSSNVDTLGDDPDVWVTDLLELAQLDPVEQEFALKDGRWIRFRRQRISDGRVVAFHTDITHLKSLDTLKDEFIAVSSHELRTPITSILGSVKMLNEGILGEMPEKAKDVLDIAVRNSERLAMLVDDILDLSKIETGKLDLKRETILVSELMVQAVDLNSEFAAGFSCPLIIGDSVDDVTVSADRHRILQILTNLLSNAAKFSTDGEPVTISSKIDGHSVVISVTNKGQGISKEFEGQIFKKFAQADLSDARTKKGTGLGLSISKALAELHGGSLTFDSVPDQETSFHLFLDLNRD